MSKKQMSMLLLLMLLSASWPALSPASDSVASLGSPQVRRELNIAPDVARKIVSNLNAANQARYGGTGARPLQPSAKQEVVRQRVDPEAMDRETFALLNSTQKKRLEQIDLQRGGPFIFQDFRFASRVGVSASQHKRIRAVSDREFQRYVRGVNVLMKDRQSWYGKLDRKRYARRYAASEREFIRLGEVRSASEREVVARVLTPTQKAKWKTLLGKPFLPHRLTYDIRSYPID